MGEKKRKKKKDKENAIKSYKIVKTKVTGDYHSNPSKKYHIQLITDCNDSKYHIGHLIKHLQLLNH